VMTVPMISIKRSLLIFKGGPNYVHWMSKDWIGNSRSLIFPIAAGCFCGRNPHYTEDKSEKKVYEIIRSDESQGLLSLRRHLHQHRVVDQSCGQVFQAPVSRGFFRCSRLLRQLIRRVRNASWDEHSHNLSGETYAWSLSGMISVRACPG